MSSTTPRRPSSCGSIETNLLTFDENGKISFENGVLFTEDRERFFENGVLSEPFYKGFSFLSTYTPVRRRKTKTTKTIQIMGKRIFLSYLTKVFWFHLFQFLFLLLPIKIYSNYTYKSLLPYSKDFFFAKVKGGETI